MIAGQNELSIKEFEAGAEAQFEALRRELEGDDTRLQVTIVCHPSVVLGDLQRVMDICQRIGVESLSVKSSDEVEQ